MPRLRCVAGTILLAATAPVSCREVTDTPIPAAVIGVPDSVRLVHPGAVQLVIDFLR